MRYRVSRAPLGSTHAIVHGQIVVVAFKIHACPDSAAHPPTAIDDLLKLPQPDIESPDFVCDIGDTHIETLFHLIECAEYLSETARLVGLRVIMSEKDQHLGSQIAVDEMLRY